MALWEQILIGVLALLVLFWFAPGARAALEKSRDTGQKDWKGVLIPVFVVVLFVLFLIAMVQE